MYDCHLKKTTSLKVPLERRSGRRRQQLTMKHEPRQERAPHVTLMIVMVFRSAAESIMVG